MPGVTPDGTRYASEGAEVRCMRVAIPIWQERLSPVFDTAARIVVFETGQVEPEPCEEFRLAGHGLGRCLGFLQQAQVQCLLCGAISNGWRRQLEIGGIRVVPFLTGPWRGVLQAFEEERLHAPRYHMPGCRGRRCRRRGGGPGRQEEQK